MEQNDHKIILERRNKLIISGGVQHVHNFDSSQIILESSYGFIKLIGEDLHIEELNLDEGNITAVGDFTGVQYTEEKDFKKKGKNVLSRMLK